MSAATYSCMSLKTIMCWNCVSIKSDYSILRLNPIDSKQCADGVIADLWGPSFTLVRPHYKPHTLPYLVYTSLYCFTNLRTVSIYTDHNFAGWESLCGGPEQHRLEQSIGVCDDDGVKWHMYEYPRESAVYRRGRYKGLLP
jgi:hypothetical protein